MGEIKFKDGIVEDYTLVLSTRDYRKLGQLTGIKNVNITHYLNSADEISFSLSKYDFVKDDNLLSEEEIVIYTKIKNAIWEQIVDFKLIWVKELDEYFEIKVSIDDSYELTKTITGKALCESELSQILITAEINTEDDIARDDYVITKFYDENNPNGSLLHRVLDKAPNYHIEFVDDSLKNIQRSFSISNSSIYDFFVGECSDEINCLFQFNSATRGISVFDLYTVCNDCGERGEFYDECPKCKSKNLKYFGKDTSIYVDKNNLTNDIHLETDADSVKNCFRLVAGDDLMTATVRSLNPNGSDYIYYISDYQRKDMPSELVKKLDEYDSLCESYNEEQEQLVSDIYELTDEIIYKESGMMPTIEDAEITASTEAEKLTAMNLSPLGLSTVTTSTSIATVNSALKNYAKVYVKTGYVKIEIDSDATFTYDGKDEDGYNYGTWHGRFTVTNYSDENDVAQSEYITIKVYDNYQDFVQQKILKNIAQSSEDDENTVFDVLNIDELEDFKEALRLYCRSRLESFFDAIQVALDVLIQLDQANEYADLYEALYVPYYDKLQACQNELDLRQGEIDSLQLQLDEKLSRQKEIQSILDFKTYLGDYYNTFCAYRREDTYSNENYISDGLSNAEIIKMAKQFIETAKSELYKSSEQQVSISSTLHNLLIMDEFSLIVQNFKLGNWIRVRVDGVLYRLRLIGYSIKFESIQSLDVEFSNVYKVKDIVDESKQIIQSAQSMAKSYGYVSRQADKGNVAQELITGWIQNGLNGALVKLFNNNNQEVTYGKGGILCRSYDDISGTYDPEQLKLTHNTICYTANNWKSVRSVIGKYDYFYYDKVDNQWKTQSGYGIVGDAVTAGIVAGCDIVGGELYSENYSDGTNDRPAMGTYINLNDGTFSFAGGNLTYDGKDFVISDTVIGDSIQTVGVLAENLHVKAANIDGTVNAEQINTKGLIAENFSSTTIEGKAIIGGSLIIGNKENTFAEISSDGVLTCNGATFTGVVTGSKFVTSGSIIKYASDYTEDDVTLVQNIIIGVVDVTDEYLEKYDLNGDGFIDSADYLRVSKLANGTVESYTIDTSVVIDPLNSSSILKAEGVYIRPNGIYSKSLSSNSIYLKNNLYIYDVDQTQYLGGVSGTFTSSDGSTIKVINGVIVSIT